MGPGGPGPGAWLYDGHLVASFGPDGTASVQSFTGTSSALCAALSYHAKYRRNDPTTGMICASHLSVAGQESPWHEFTS